MLIVLCEQTGKWPAIRVVHSPFERKCMKLAIMQPYFLPYIGYFQLMNIVDKFVIYDNVQFIKDGWINRNRILVNQQDKMFTLPLKKDTYTVLINERFLAKEQWRKEQRKLIMQIEQNYRKAPCYREVYPIIVDCIQNDSERLVDLIEYALRQLRVYLGISCELILSSTLNVDQSLAGQGKVLSICKEMGATQYINAIGGVDLYNKKTFRDQGIQLSFIKSKEIVYPQFKNEFMPWLSIIDVMMFNPAEKIQEYLNRYELV